MDVWAVLNVTGFVIGAIGFVLAIVSLVIALRRVRAARESSRLEGEITAMLAVLVAQTELQVDQPRLMRELIEGILTRASQLSGDDQSFGELLDRIRQSL